MDASSFPKTPVEVFDTDLISECARANRVAVERLKQTPHDLRFTTIINEAELVGPRYRQLLTAANEMEMTRAQLQLNVVRDLLANSFTEVIPTDIFSSRIYAELKRIKKLAKVDNADLIIASIALRHDALLVTGNIEHFRKVPRLKVEDFRR